MYEMNIEIKKMKLKNHYDKLTERIPESGIPLLRAPTSSDF